MIEGALGGLSSPFFLVQFFFFFFWFMNHFLSQSCESQGFTFFKKNFINECLLFAIYFVVKCEFMFMFMFMFVILKEKIINHQENVKLIFFFFF